ncbi:hypothetical protein BDZ89DRAFT_222484 [Hymenopellis radicata]|nr:hypothetical protein BDZ89DRAFT_222484 [Hymenopellis radicata]
MWPSNMVLAAVFRMFISLVAGIGHPLPNTTGNTDTIVDAFNDVPCLKTLTLYDSPHAEQLLSEMLESFPCHQLTHMSCYTFVLVLPMCSLLQRLINLEDLTLQLGLIDFELEPADRITLPALKRIDLIEYGRGGNAGTVALFLSFLRLPRIRDLSIAFHHYICFEDLDSHPDFHQITTLRIEGCMLRMPDPVDDYYIQVDYMGGTKTLLNFLNLMTGVEEFQLEDRKVSGDFLLGLVVGGAEEDVVRLPCLRTLDLHGCRFENDTEYVNGLILNIVNSRSAVRSALQSPCSALQKLVVPGKWKNSESVSSWAAILDSVELVFRCPVEGDVR